MNKKVYYSLFIASVFLMFLTVLTVGTVPANSAEDTVPTYETVYASDKTGWSTPCYSIWKKCADIKINGSDGPLTFKAPASYTVGVLSQDGAGPMSGAHCFYYNPFRKVMVKVIESSDVVDAIFGPKWYVQNDSNVGAGQYKYKFYCKTYAGSAETFEDAIDVCVYDSAVGGCGVSPPINSPYTKTEVFLTANSTNLTIPASGGSVYTNLTATVQCNVPGAVNYTFYCNRSDAGTNITGGYISNFAVEPDGWKTIRGAKCSYSSPGIYTAKVIANQVGNVAEDRVTITVTKKGASSPAPTVKVWVDPLSINLGETTTFSWSSTDATSCTGSRGGSYAVGGSFVHKPPSLPYQYGMKCTGPGGTSPMEYVSVTQKGVPPPPPPPPSPQCSDSADNDGDGKIDFPADPGCSSTEDNDESDAPPPVVPFIPSPSVDIKAQ